MYSSPELGHRKLFPIGDAGIKEIGWNTDNIFDIPVEQLFLHGGCVVFDDRNVVELFR